MGKPGLSLLSMVPAMDLIETLLFNGSMIYSSMQRKTGCWLVISTSIELSHRNRDVGWIFLPLPTGLVIFPNTLLPMARLTPDHIPCKVQIGTSIPKAQIFRFQNFWVEYQGFYDLVKYVWSTNILATNSATRITTKFKLLRAALKKWSRSLSNLKC